MEEKIWGRLDAREEAEENLRGKGRAIFRKRYSACKNEGPIAFYSRFLSFQHVPFPYHFPLALAEAAI